MTRTAFGRRSQGQSRQAQIAPVPRAAALPAAASAARAEPAVEHPFSLEMESDGASLEQELQAWKKSRSFNIPWRQLNLMASLCFGLASFVLPSGVNDWVDWLLYALMAMSFYAWYTGRRAKKKS
jgi:hypothetical protein